MITLPVYIALSLGYLLFMHLALSTTREFQAFINMALFIFGGVIGHYVDSYLAGFVFAAVMHFIFWSKGSD